MEWETLKSEKDGSGIKLRAGMATQRNPEVEALEKAAEAWRKQRGEEKGRAGGKTRAQRKKERDPRLESLEEAAEDWERKKAGRGKEEKKTSWKEIVGIKERPPKEGIKKPAGAKTEGKGVETGWPQFKLSDWMEKRFPELVPQEKQKRRLNSSGMSVLVMMAVAKEKAKALGRIKPRPDPLLVAMEQATAMQRAKEEEERMKVRREIGMLQKLVQLMSGDRVFDEQKEEHEEWSIGQVNCFVDKVPQNGWNLIVVALERSQFINRWEWGDLLGVYRAELDDQLNLKDYGRVTPVEIEEYLRSNKQ